MCLFPFFHDPRVVAQNQLNVGTRTVELRTDWDALLYGMQFCLTWHLHARSMAGSGGQNIFLGQNRTCGGQTLHTHTVPDGENIAKVGKGLLLNIGNKPASLEIVPHGLLNSHRLDVLLSESASLAVALAYAAVRDCRTICNAILARGQNDVLFPRPHCRAQACVELLWDA